MVLSHRLWRSQFAADPAIVNKSIILDGEPYTVIGVMPARIGVDLLDPELWRPSDLGLFGGALTLDGQPRREIRDLNLAVARLKPGISIEQAEQQMAEIADRLAHTYPVSNAGWGVSVRLWPRPIAQDFERSLYLLLAAVVMLLLIGCVNIANLAMGRGFARAREIAIRSALGARRGRLVRQLVVENLVLAIIGGLMGIGVAHVLVSLMTAVLQSTGPTKVVPSDTEISIDGAVWVFGVMLSLICGIAFSIVPALTATRAGLETAMKEGAEEAKRAVDTHGQSAGDWSLLKWRSR